MQAATITGMAGFGDMWSDIKNGVERAGDAAKGALQQACGLAAMIPPVSPYLAAGQMACAVAMPPAVTGGSPGTVASTTGTGLATLNQQMTQMQQQAALMALTAAKPWYKKPLPWVGIGAGVLAVGTGVVLMTRKGGGRRGRR